MLSSIELLAGADPGQMIEGQRTYEVQHDAENTMLVTLAAPDLKAEGLHLQTWGSSYLLANRLHRIPVTCGEPRPFSVLELGAGTGLVGLCAAAIWKTTVMLTDFPSIVPGTAANVALNQALLDAHGGHAMCGSLDWRSPETVEAYTTNAAKVISSGEPGTRPAIIVSADTLYTSEQPAILSSTILTWLRRDSSARAIICYPLRVAALDAINDFWARMEDGGMETVDQGQERIEDDQWDDEKLHEWSVWRWKPEWAPR